MFGRKKVLSIKPGAKITDNDVEKVEVDYVTHFASRGLNFYK